MPAKWWGESGSKIAATIEQLVDYSADFSVFESPS